MKNVLFVMLASITSVASAAWFEGENLLTSFVPGEQVWAAFEKATPDFKSTMWKNRENQRDIYVVSMRAGAEQSLEEFRDIQDAPGKRSCADFTSKTLTQEKTNGYPRLVWQTRCIRENGTAASILFTAIRGRDQLYFVQKIWGYEPSQEEVDLWRERLRAVSLCDTRRESQSCPKGYSKIDEFAG